MYLVLESPAGTDKTLVALQAAHRFVKFFCSLDESLLGQRTMLQVADNLFDSYIGACEKSDNAEPLLLVTVCQKKRCISHEIFAILYLDKREEDLENNQETRWIIRTGTKQTTKHCS